MLDEALTKAADSAALLVRDLNDAHAAADPVLAMLLFDLLKDAARLRERLDAVTAARSSAVEAFPGK